MDRDYNLISDETVYGRNTVIEVNDQYYYLGDVVPDIVIAVCLWQDLNGRKLTTEELRYIMLENHLISEAI